MRTLRPLAFVLLAAGCGIDIIGVGASDQNDVTPPTVEASTPDATTVPIDAQAEPDAAIVDAAPDANDAHDAADANPCALCPSGTARSMCTNSRCKAVRRVFTTKAGFAPNFGSVAQGDTACQSAATAAGLGGTWMAWLSSTGSSPQSRFTTATVPYVRLDGIEVFASGAKLLPSGGSATLENALDHDEHGNALPTDSANNNTTEVWTGTDDTGSSYGPGASGGGSYYCNNWTSTAQSSSATVGVFTAKDGSFTFVYEQNCDRTNPHLYCFEQ